MAATFRIVVDAAGVQAAFAVIESQARRANRVIASEARRTTDEGARAMGGYRDAVVRSVAQRQAAETRFNSVRMRLAQQAQAVVDRQVEMGVTSEERAASEKTRIYRQLATSYIREEQRKTEADRREARVRATIMDTLAARAAEHATRAVGRVARAGFGIASGAASDVLGQAREARASRAGAEHNINNALSQAGAGVGGNTSALRQRMYDWARSHGVDSGELAQAALGAQTEFSVFGTSRSNDADRSANVNQFLGNAELARNTYQDVGQVTRVAGMLQNAGITGTAQRQTLLGFTGLAQRGAIELSGVSGEALQPIMARMHDARSRLLARNPSATPEEIAREQGGAATTAFAELEVARGQGQGARRFATSMATLGTELQGGHRQDLIRGNIQNARGITDAQRASLMGMFDHGQLRAQFQSGLGFASHVSEALGGNEALMRNIFAGSGHGNAQGLQSNWRNAMAAMMSGGTEVRSMIAGVGHDYTEGDVDRTKALVDSETNTQLVAQNEQHIQALMSNTAALTALNAMDAYKAGHPVEAALAQQVGGDAAVLALSQGNGGAGGQLSYEQMRQARQAAGVSAAGGRASFYWRALTSGGASPYDAANDSDPAFRQRYQAALQREVGARGGTVTQGNLVSEIATGVSQGVTSALASGHLTASIDERTAQHAVATTRGAPSGATHTDHH